MYVQEGETATALVAAADDRSEGGRGARLQKKGKRGDVKGKRGGSQLARGKWTVLT